MNGYCHTQKGIIRPILLVVTVAFLAGARFVGTYPTLPIYLASAGVCVVMSFAFGHLTVRDDGDRLVVSFGPLTLFRKTISYSQITHLEKDRSTFLAGWGIHWTRKGWLWNIGGYDCVKIEMGDKSMLIGTDDPDGLVSFLRSQTGR